MSEEGALQRMRRARDWAKAMAEREADWRLTDISSFHSVAERIVVDLDVAIGQVAEAVARLDWLQEQREKGEA